MIAEVEKAKIRKANLANIVRKVKAGKPLTKLELEIIDDQDEPPAEAQESVKPSRRGAKRKALSVYSLATETGIDQRTIRKRLVDAGLYPPENHPKAAVLDAIKPPSGDKDGDSIKERKTFEEWRKLKLANDENEALLIPRALVAETVFKLGPRISAVLEARLVNQYPTETPGLDVIGMREYGRKLAAQILTEFQSFADVWQPKTR